AVVRIVATVAQAGIELAAAVEWCGRALVVRRVSGKDDTTPILRSRFAIAADTVVRTGENDRRIGLAVGDDARTRLHVEIIGSRSVTDQQGSRLDRQHGLVGIVAT